MNRRDLIKSAVATALTVGLAPAQGSLGLFGGMASAATKQYVGTNLNQLSYYTTEQPFLNLFKQAAANGIGSLPNTWFVDSISVDPYLLLDSDGNVTSMKNSQGTTHTKIFTWISENLNGGSLPPGAASFYPTGNYRLQFSGPGTFYVGRDMTVPAQTPPAGVTISANSVTSTLAMGVSASITVTVATASQSGIEVGLTSLPNDGVNYIKFISLVQSSLASSYDGGEIFHPNFLASLSPFSRLRFMDWANTNNQEHVANFTADLPLNATGGTLASAIFNGYISGTTLTVTSWAAGQYTSLNGLKLDGPGVTAGTTVTGGSGNSWTVSVSQTVGSSGSPVHMATEVTWSTPPGTYTFIFANGQVINNVTCTYGSSAVTWSTPLSAAVSSSTVYGAMSYWLTSPSWSARPLMSNFSWAGAGGVPHEVRVLLCNRLGVDCWNNIPIGVNFADSTYALNLAKLMHDGTGASIATPVTSFTGLNAAQKAYIELSNEVWNNFPQNGFSMMIGKPTFPTASNQYYSGQEWYGTQVAGVGDAFYTAYGATDFSNRVIVSMGAQLAAGNGPAFLKIAMNTPDWTSAAYTHHIGAFHFAPYLQILSGMSTAGIDAINALADPTGAVFALAYTSVYGGTDYSTYGLSTAGWVKGSSTGPNALAAVLADTNISGQTWHTLPVLGYEGGEGTELGTSDTTAEQTLFKNVYRDSRMRYIYSDKGHVLSANDGYFYELVAVGMQSVNVFNDCTSAAQNLSYWAQFGDWGQIENVMQLPVNGSAPGKWQGCYDYAHAV